MTDTMKTVLPLAIAAIALGIIFVGLSDSGQSTPTVEDRVSSLSAAIKCPFCNGESLEDSASAVAADYRVLIKERIEAGATDGQILDEFASNFGDSFILDTSTSGWAAALWAIPVSVLIGGLFAVTGLRRASKATEPERR